MTVRFFDHVSRKFVTYDCSFVFPFKSDDTFYLELCDSNCNVLRTIDIVDLAHVRCCYE